MLGRDVQRLEVVPRVFHLRPFGRRETQPAHDLLQLVDRLRDRMQPAQPQADAGHRGIERGTVENDRIVGLRATVHMCSRTGSFASSAAAS